MNGKLAINHLEFGAPYGSFGLFCHARWRIGLGPGDVRRKYQVPLLHSDI